MNAEEVLINLISIITLNLEELKNYSSKNQFIFGEKTAYVECLEVIQSWEKSGQQNLNYNVQKKYL